MIDSKRTDFTAIATCAEKLTLSGFSPVGDAFAKTAKEIYRH